jgi:acyl-CoA synthetase (AMP-forming)/AMP-acid ligase II
MRVVDEQRHEVAQGEVGEIAIRGHDVMKGYWNRPEATAEAIDEDGWFYTGDIGRVDEDGYFFIVDRKKELIIRGGYNVYPREIEEVIYEHPAVLEAAVVGVRTTSWGRRSALRWRSNPAPRSRLRSCASTSRLRWPRTSIPATCGSSMSCPRARPAMAPGGGLAVVEIGARLFISQHTVAHRRALRPSCSTAATSATGKTLTFTTRDVRLGRLPLLARCQGPAGSGKGRSHRSRGERARLVESPHSPVRYGAAAFESWFRRGGGRSVVRRMHSHGTALTTRATSWPIRMTPGDPSPARA